MIDTKKIRITTTGNGLCHLVTDTNKGRRCVAEVLDCAAGGFNCRIDRNGKPWKYCKGIKVTTPLAAYEYTQQFGTAQEEWAA